jgi:manganese/zinc/iron transport system substrate-binding protein
MKETQAPKMKKSNWLTIAVIVAACCAVTSARANEKRHPITAVATTGMVADIVRHVGGDRVALTQLMGPGVDPHLYKPTSGDVMKLSQARIIFYSGLKLEGRMEEVFARLSRVGKPVYAITRSVPESLLLKPAEFEDHFDPHVWLDVSLWAQTVPTIIQGLSKVDPQGRGLYEKNGAALIERLEKLHEWCKEKAAALPREHRILVTSHDAFNYFGRAYGFKVVALQGVSTVSEAALADVASLVDFIKRQGVKAIFVETSVNPAAIRRVAEDAGVRIGGELFSDALGEPGEVKDGFDVGSYEGMIRYNMSTIINALK